MLKEDVLAEVERLRAENESINKELSDLKILYDTIAEHADSVENELEEKNIALELAQKRLRVELKEATKYILSILPDPLLSPPILAQWKLIPSSELGGDSFGYNWVDKDHFAFYLLDVCGHGVGAALLSVTAINVLRRHALPDTNFCEPEQVLTAMNQMFDIEKQNGMFFTLWYGVYDVKDRVLSYGSAGHWPAVMLHKDNDGVVDVSLLSTLEGFIGFLPNLKYEQYKCSVAENSRIFLFSDGAFELELGNGDMFTFNGFLNYLERMYAGSKYDLNWLIGRLSKLTANRVFDDDLAIVQLDITS